MGTRVNVGGRFVAALLALAATAAPAAAEWRRIDSPNFTVVGDVGAGDLREITRRFENFRDVLGRVLNSSVTSTAVPTVVIVFPSDSAFTPFKPKFNGKPVALTGLFLPRRDANYIALVRDWDESAMRVVFHEYAHLITSNSTQRLPVWLNEGVAEFYSTFQMVTDREALIGRIVPGHVERLTQQTLMPLEELLGVKHDSPQYNEGDRRSLFYAQSWALTHMLLIGQPAGLGKLGAYVAGVEAGTAPADAWRAAFGAERPERDLQNYIRRSTFNAYRLKFSEKTAGYDGEAASMAKGDAEAFLAHFLAQQQRYDEALERLDRSAKADGDTEWQRVVRALVAAARNDNASASRALTGVASPADWLLAYFAANGLADLVSDSSGDAKAPLRQSARSLFDATRKLRGDIPNALARIAWLDLGADGPPTPEGLATIQRARQLAPGRHDYAFLHAQLLAELDDYAAASAVLGSLMTAAAPPDVRESARNIQRQIQQLQQYKATRNKMNALTGAPPAPSDNSVGGASREDLTLQPALRRPAAGETQVKGALERIECTGRIAVFVVRTAEGPTRLNGGALDQVDFITYRDDLSGSIGCGPLKEPMPVIVTQGPAADGKTTRVVAVEFLPKSQPLFD